MTGIYPSYVEILNKSLLFYFKYPEFRNTMSILNKLKELRNFKYLQVVATDESLSIVSIFTIEFLKAKDLLILVLEFIIKLLRCLSKSSEQ